MQETTKLKFYRSKQGELVGFISQDSTTKKLRGVREDSEFKKKVAVLHPRMKSVAKEGVLYYATVKPMQSGKGYIVENLSPVLFKAQIETVLIPNSVYKVIARFGSRVIFYDKLGGGSESSNTLDGAVAALMARVDIEDKDMIVRKFIEAADYMDNQILRDGMVHSQRDWECEN
ncbi:MAG: hypothetical protein ACRDD8_06320 [Bacteroidales bacterium]